jgi:uncharacterized NAD(P)/FAD-binding protein YdhS
MLAARLAERGQASVLINRTPEFGLGVAYGAAGPEHRLNVRSDRMSAVEDRPDDFVRWLGANAPDHADPNAFAPRRLYGRYVQDRLAAVEAACPGVIQRLVGDAMEITETGVRLADGRTIGSRAVVLATGNPPPRTAGAAERVVADPWAPGALNGIEAEDDLLILGTGLTTVDVLQSLEGRGWRGWAVAVSRRGLLPRPHRPTPDAAADLPGDALSGPLSQRLRAVRRAEAPWRGIMEAFRPITADLWAGADRRTRARFLRHLRPWWDVHRHRLAPEIGRWLEGLLAGGRLTVRAGRVRELDATSESVRLTVLPRGGGEAETLSAAWLIDCTGPAHAPGRDPLTAPLIAGGRARLEPTGLGLDLDACGRVRDASGKPDLRLFVLGPPARGAFWETVAVPDIRKRIETLTQALLEP